MQLTKCVHIWPNIAHLIKCVRFVNWSDALPKCADWSNAPYIITALLSYDIIWYCLEINYMPDHPMYNYTT